MGIQKLIPYNSALLGLRNQFIEMYDKKSFYINNSCIKVKDKMLHINEEYSLLNSNRLNDTTQVRLLDVCCSRNMVYLILINVNNGVVLLQYLDIESEVDVLRWSLN